MHDSSRVGSGDVFDGMTIIGQLAAVTQGSSFADLLRNDVDIHDVLLCCHVL